MDWEDRLREIDLPAPPTATRRALLREAARRQSGRRRAAVLRWATATLAAALIAVNVVVGSLQEQKLATMIGPATSPARTAGSMRVPSPIKHRQLGWRMPEGIRWSLNSCPSTTTVCPALFPPW